MPYNMLMDMEQVDTTALDGLTTEQTQTAVEQDSVSWTASEFLHHQKPTSWYAAVSGVSVLAGAILFLLTKDLIGPLSIVILTALLLVGAAKKPRTLDYLVDQDGVVVGNKEYAFDDFQSFNIVREDQIESIALIPHKRLKPAVSLYFSPDDAQKIFDVISEHLPFEKREQDPIDKFLHKIRF